ncbi:MAG: LptF/LptG family permease [Deltaproteobacteria bacterium]|nr:LptF/LptG family permease [Deltaproteobacteria bacterium]
MLKKIIFRYFLAKISLYFLLVFLGFSTVFISVTLLEKLDTVARFEGSFYQAFIVAILEWWTYSNLVLLMSVGVSVGIFFYALRAQGELRAYKALGYSLTSLRNLIIFFTCFTTSIFAIVFDKTQMKAHVAATAQWKSLKGEPLFLRDLILSESNWLLLIKAYEMKTNLVSGIYAFKKNSANNLEFILTGRRGIVEFEGKAIAIKPNKIIRFLNGNILDFKVARFRDLNYWIIPTRPYTYAISPSSAVTPDSGSLLFEFLSSKQHLNGLTLASKFVNLYLGNIFTALLATILCTTITWTSIFPHIFCGACAPILYTGLFVIKMTVVNSLGLGGTVFVVSWVATVLLLLLVRVD